MIIPICVSSVFKCTCFFSSCFSISFYSTHILVIVSLISATIDSLFLLVIKWSSIKLWNTIFYLNYKELLLKNGFLKTSEQCIEVKQFSSYHLFLTMKLLHLCVKYIYLTQCLQTSIRTPENYIFQFDQTFPPPSRFSHNCVFRQKKKKNEIRATTHEDVYVCHICRPTHHRLPLLPWTLFK